MTLFTVGSIVCAVAKNFTMMLVGRSIQGSGGGGILALTEIIITDLVPLRERGNFFALISIVWAIGSVGGPLVGGALGNVDAWDWIFFLNLPFVAIGFAGIIAFLRLGSRPRTFKQKIREVDYVGSVLFVASTTSLILAITWGGVMFDWSSWHTLVPLIVGIAGLVLFCLYEGLVAKYTLLPLALFKTPSTSLAYFVTFIHGIILWSVLYYMPLFFEGAQEYSTILAGVTALPQTLTVVPCAALVGVIATKTGYYRWALWAGWVLTTLGIGIMYLLDPVTSVPAWVFIMLVSGIGIGLLFPAMNLAIQASAPSKDIAAAAGMFIFFRCFGQGLGVAIGGVIFQNQMEANLSGVPNLGQSAAELSSDIVALIATIRSMPADDPTTDILRWAFSNSIRTIWAVMCGLAGIAMLSSFFIKHYDLNQDLDTEQGFENREARGDSEQELRQLSEGDKGLKNRGDGVGSSQYD